MHEKFPKPSIFQNKNIRKDVAKGLLEIKFESRNTVMRRRTTANMYEIKKYILDTNISSCHAGLFRAVV